MGITNFDVDEGNDKENYKKYKNYNIIIHDLELPNGNGKKYKIAVLCEKEDEMSAKTVSDMIDKLKPEMVPKKPIIILNTTTIELIDGTLEVKQSAKNFHKLGEKLNGYIWLKKIC